MRGVGDEGTLRRERGLEPGQQIVERQRQRFDFFRNVADGKRRQRVGGARLHRSCELRQGPQAAADQKPNQQGQCRQQNEEGLERTPRGVGRKLIAHAHRLRDGDRQTVVLQGEYPPIALAARRGRIAEAREFRQRLVRPRIIDLEPGEVPDPNHVVETLVAGQCLGRPLESLIAQRQRDLLQLVIEQRTGLVARRPVSGPAAQQHHHGHGDEQGEEQMAAY